MISFKSLACFWFDFLFEVDGLAVLDAKPDGRRRHVGECSAVRLVWPLWTEVITMRERQKLDFSAGLLDIPAMELDLCRCWEAILWLKGKKTVRFVFNQT